MTIGIDLRCVPVDGTAGAGVAHAARFLTEALLEKEVSWTWRLYVPTCTKLTRSHQFRTCLSDSSGGSIRKALHRDPCDLLFVPSGAIAPGLDVPAIPLVHDLAIFDHPEWFPQPLLRRFVTTTLFRHGIKKSPIVFAISEDTKRDIVTRFRIPEDRIHVTYLGGDPLLAAIDNDHISPSKQPFILVLGTVEPRKNIPMVIRAWEKARPSFSHPVELVIAGRDGWGREGKNIQFSISKGVRRIKDLDDDMRRHLLRTASIVAVPSLHEGFGLVALEAMQAGMAVVASKRGALPEVVGAAGILLDPDDERSWSETFIRLMSDGADRLDLAKRGKVRSRIFSWNRAAETVIQGLRSIV